MHAENPLTTTVGSDSAPVPEVNVQADHAGKWHGSPQVLQNIISFTVHRGETVMKVRVGDLATNGPVRSRAIIVQQKTGLAVHFELLESARTSIWAWPQFRGGALAEDAARSRTHPTNHPSKRQYARLVGEWVNGIGPSRNE